MFERRFGLGALVAVVALTGCSVGGKSATPDTLACARSANSGRHFGCTVQNERASAHGWYELGVVAQRDSESKAAASDFEKSIVVEPRFAAALYDLGVLRLRSHDYSTAIALLCRAVDANPKDAHAHFELGRALAGLHTAADDARSRTQMNEARTLDPVLAGPAPTTHA